MSKIYGLTGGIAAGKSTILDFLKLMVVKCTMLTKWPVK
jgi:Dephospho-CoA kinase